MKKVCIAIIMFLMLFPGYYKRSQAQSTKSPVKVLFVGYDVNRMPQEFRKGLDEFTLKDSVRMPSFKELLNNYFAEVKTMDCRDWKIEDSESFDVTIFDYRTTPIEKGSYSDDKYIPSRFLPDDFSKPTIFIGSTADIMGRRIGLKLDWYCLCLYADAHHLDTHHAIFNGPIEKVVPTMRMEKTPDNIYEYPSGDTIPKQIPMWKVQTKSFGESDSLRIGMVARGERFADSPDVEMISSGVCTKNVTAVALARHGNFFMWGFAAAPSNMTEEAKKVFVNTVAYMKQFEGQLPIARKYNDRMATTDHVKDIVNRANREWWKKNVDYVKKANKEMLIIKKKVEEKEALGQPLTELEEMYKDISPETIPTWENYLEKAMGPFYEQFKNDADAYKKFMNENMDFMYCDPQGFFSYYIDEDVKKINVSNHSIKLLETCIEMLKENNKPELALRVLKRYTPENFESVVEWETWYNTNKDRLFFTETGGYKFLVNTYIN